MKKYDIIIDMKNVENNNNKTLYENYTTKSSSLVFILALFLPSLVSSVIALIVGVEKLSNNMWLYYTVLALMQIVFFAIFYGYNKIGKYNIKKCSKINFNLNYKQILVIILIALVSVFSFSPLVNLFQAVLKQMGFGAGSSEGVNKFLTSFGGLVLNIVVVGILPAICEELVFRGVILNGFSKYKKWGMVMLSATMFMIMHMSINQSIYQLFLGIVLALVVIETGSIISSMILHMTNNIVILLSNYIYNINGITPVGEYKFTVWNCIYPILIAIVGVIAVILLIKLLRYFTKQKNLKTNQIINDNETQSQIDNSLQDSPATKIKGLDEKSSDIFWTCFGLVVGLVTWVISIL